MVEAVLLFLFLIGLTYALHRVADWFQEVKNINILPSSLIEVIAVIIFMVTYGGSSTRDIVLMCISIAVVLIITAYNIIEYGPKDGILASLAELVFSVSSAILILIILFSADDKKKRKKRK